MIVQFDSKAYDEIYNYLAYQTPLGLGGVIDKIPTDDLYLSLIGRYVTLIEDMEKRGEPKDKINAACRGLNDIELARKTFMDGLNHKL
jgi:hypothetical protein